MNTTSILSAVCLVIPIIIQGNEDIAIALSDLSLHYMKNNNVVLAHKYGDLALQGGNTRVWYTYACEYAKKGDIKKARECLQKLPSECDGGIFIGTAILDNNIEQAMNYVQAKHPSESKDHLYDIIGAAQICSHFGRYDYAETFYQKALEYTDQSLSFLDPDVLDLHREISKFYRKQGDFDNALLYLSLIFSRRKHSIYDEFAVGKIWYKQGKLDQAKGLLTSDSVDAHWAIDKYRALLYCGLGNIDQCKVHLNRLYTGLPQKLDSSNLNYFIKEQKRISEEAELLLSLGLAYMQATEYKTALPYLEQAQSLFDKVYVKESLEDLPELYEALTTSYTQLKQHRKAQALQKMLTK